VPRGTQRRAARYCRRSAQAPCRDSLDATL
jgi:hypothetical protein